MITGNHVVIIVPLEVQCLRDTQRIDRDMVGNSILGETVTTREKAAEIWGFRYQDATNRRLTARDGVNIVRTDLTIAVVLGRSGTGAIAPKKFASIGGANLDGAFGDAWVATQFQ